MDAKTATSGDAQSEASGKEVRTGNSGKSNENQDLVEKGGHDDFKLYDYSRCF